MLPTWISWLSSIAMAVGPPLVYADQAASIIRKKDSSGFSCDVCAILLLANITRCFFWLGSRFELTMLLQSVLMILAQLALLFICITYPPKLSPEALGISKRPWHFWQWPTYGQYVEFLAGFILCLTILFLVLSGSATFIAVLGFLALGLESTLPIPQLISNFKRRSLYGFRLSTLLGWVGGDTYKTVYFILNGLPLQFRACAVFQLSIDLAIIVQRLAYGNKPPPMLAADADLEEALVLAEE